MGLILVFAISYIFVAGLCFYYGYRFGILKKWSTEELRDEIKRRGYYVYYATWKKRQTKLGKYR